MVLCAHAGKLTSSLTSDTSKYSAMISNNHLCRSQQWGRLIIFPIALKSKRQPEMLIKGPQIQNRVMSLWRTSPKYSVRTREHKALLRLKAAVSPSEQANGIAAEDLRLDFCNDEKAHNLTGFGFSHCRWEMTHNLSLAETFWNGCKRGLNNLLLSVKRDEDPCQSSHLLSAADKGVLPGKRSGWEVLILSVCSVRSRIWAKHRELWWLQNTFLENVFWSVASKLHQPSSLLRRTFSVLGNSQLSVGLLQHLCSGGGIGRRN